MFSIHQFSRKTTRTMLLCGVCGLAWTGVAASAQARSSMPEKPSVEVNLGALRALRDAAPAQYQPAKPLPSAKPAPVVVAPTPIPVAPAISPPVVIAPAPVIVPAPAIVPPQPMVVAAPEPALKPLPAPIKPVPVVPVIEKPPVVVVPVVKPAPVAPPVMALPQSMERKVPAEQPRYEAMQPVPSVIEPLKPLPTPAVVTRSNVEFAPKKVDAALEPLKPLPELPKPPVAPTQPAPVKKEVMVAPKAIDPIKSVDVAKPVEAVKAAEPLPASPQPKMDAKAAPSEGLKPGSSIAIPLVSAGGFKPAETKSEKPRETVLAPLPEPKAAPLDKKITPPNVPKSAAAMPELAPLPEPVVKPSPAKKDAKLAESKPAPAAISTAPMMIPVTPPPASEPALLPPSVTERMKKTFDTEPPQQGIIRDVKTVKNPIEEIKKSAEVKPDAAPPTPFIKEMTGDKALGAPIGEVAAPVTGVDAKPLPPAVLPSVKPEPVTPVKAPVKTVEPLLPLPSLPSAPAVATQPAPMPKLPEPAKMVEPVKVVPEAKKPIEMPKLPEPVKAPVDVVKQVKEPALLVPALPPVEAPKTAEPVKAVEPAKKAEPVKPVVAPAALPQPPVLPMPMPPLGTKPEVKAVVPEKLPPAELPLPKAEQKPIILPKTEIASLPKMDTKPAPVAPLPELPKPPVAVAEPAKKEASALKPADVVKPTEPVALPVPEKEAKLALPTLPKFPIENELKAPAKPALPPLTAIIGDKPTSSADILQPKDGIQAKSLMADATPTAPTALPKFPTDASSAKPALPVLPSLPPVEKSAEVKVVVAKPEQKATPPALPLPSVAKVDAAKDEKQAAPVAPTATNAAASEVMSDKLSHSVSYSKGKSDLSGDEKSKLDALAEKLKKSQASVRVVAYYSTGAVEEVPVDKRTSLARALQIRAHLIEKGVNPQTISTQALGNKDPNGNSNRADVFVK